MKKLNNEKLNEYISKVVSYCDRAYLHLTDEQIAGLSEHIAKHYITDGFFVVEHPTIYQNSFGQFVSMDPDETNELIPLDSERAIQEGAEIANRLYDR